MSSGQTEPAFSEHYELHFLLLDIFNIKPLDEAEDAINGEGPYRVFTYCGAASYDG